tara:strand:- start:195710 stop:196933 length:1224 start_codon:yes stop_codon:yes gene_type:complete
MTNKTDIKKFNIAEFITDNLKNRPLPTISVLVILAILSGLVMIRMTSVATRASADIGNVDISKALNVSTITAKALNTYSTTQKISGQVIAARESDHGFDRGGVLAEVMVDEGDRVKKGDILAILDMRKLDAREQELNADLESTLAMAEEAKVTLKRVSTDYERYVQLKENGHISQARFDQVANELESAKARNIAAGSNVNKVKAGINALQADRDMSILRARFDGSVVSRYRDEGASFGMGGGPMIRLIEDENLEIRVGLTERAANGLEIGKRYQFNQSGTDIATTLRSINAKIDQNTRTVTAIFDVENSNTIRPGSLAELSVDVVVSEEGFWLPTEALAESRRGLWSAYTLAPVDGYSDVSTLSRHELQVIYTEADKVYVRGTLNDGDKVVSSGTHKLAAGFLVKAN